MKVILEPVLETNRVLLQNLYSLYLHEMSLFTDTLDINADGLFDFEELESLWNVDGFAPFFIKESDKIVGFILLLQRPLLKKECDFAVNDFFILNPYKRRGIGKEAIKTLFHMKKGKFFVIQLEKNQRAVLFWKNIYDSFRIQFEENSKEIDGDPCLIQVFNT